MNKSHVFFLIQKNTKLQDLKDFFDLMDIVLFQDVPAGKYNISSGEGHSIIEIFKTFSSGL